MCDLPRWHRYHSTPLMLLGSISRWYATGSRTQTPNWSSVWGKQIGSDMLMCGYGWKTLSTVLKKSTYVKTPVRPSDPTRHSTIRALGPVSQLRLSIQRRTHLSSQVSPKEKKDDCECLANPWRLVPANLFNAIYVGKFFRASEIALTGSQYSFPNLISTNVITSRKLIRQ